MCVCGGGRQGVGLLLFSQGLWLWWMLSDGLEMSHLLVLPCNLSWKSSEVAVISASYRQGWAGRVQWWDWVLTSYEHGSRNHGLQGQPESLPSQPRHCLTGRPWKNHFSGRPWPASSESLCRLCFPVPLVRVVFLCLIRPGIFKSLSEMRDPALRAWWRREGAGGQGSHRGALCRAGGLFQPCPLAGTAESVLVTHEGPSESLQDICGMLSYMVYKNFSSKYNFLKTLAPCGVVREWPKVVHWTEGIPPKFYLCFFHEKCDILEFAYNPSNVRSYPRIQLTLWNFRYPSLS